MSALTSANSITAITAAASWQDYNGHMSEAYYLVALGESCDAFLAQHGVDHRYRDQQASFFTRETYLHHRAEIHVGEALQLSLWLLDCDERRLHVYHAINAETDGRLCAYAEQVMVHVSLQTRHSSAMPELLFKRFCNARRTPPHNRLNKLHYVRITRTRRHRGALDEFDSTKNKLTKRG